MTIADKFISITDIRKHASRYINNISVTGEKLIFVNNKPKAVLIDIKTYETFISRNDIAFEGLTGSEEVLGTEEHKSLMSLLKNA